MIRRLQHTFALSEKGAKDFVKAVVWCFLCNLSLMVPVGVVMAAIQYLLGTLEQGGDPAGKVWVYTGAAALVLLLLFVLHYFQYASLYLATYQESASRRISLAEVLRKLPLSFFGSRDLSDLTATMISDCSALDQMFSHYIPQLFASIFSTLVIGVMMLRINWKMALAVLWVLPVAVLLTAGSKKLQDTFGTKNILAKRAVTDHIQECLDTVRDIKACNRQGAMMAELDRRLEGAETSAIHAELATGVFVCFAQAFLRLGLATTVLVGAGMLARGELDFLYFLGFLFAAARLYDPLGMVLQNIAATFSAKLKIDRMRAIQEQPVQTGAEVCEPENYDIVFDHVKFAYREGEGVLEDVSFTAKQGQVTALVGPSGGGKSTACKLAARFWDIQGGQDHPGRHRHLRGGSGDPVEALFLCVPGCGAVPGHCHGEYPSGPAERHRRGGLCRRESRPVRRIYPGAAGGLSDDGGGERLHPLRRGAPAHLHRPGAFEGRPGDPAGRGHGLAGRGERVRGAGGPVPPGEEQDSAHHRPPDADGGKRG